MDEITHFLAFERSLLERVSTRRVQNDVGVVYLDEERPERFYSSFLLVHVPPVDVTAGELAERAESILGGAGFGHRMVVVDDPRLAAELGHGFEVLGYSQSWNVIMSHRGQPDREGTAQVEEVPFAEVRSLIREMYLEDPTVPDGLAEGFAEQQGKREQTIGARFFVGSSEGQHAGSCELYQDGPVAQIENVGTLERYRGRGVARSVILRALETARGSGAQHVFIVATEDDWPRHLYARLGFDQIGRSGEFLLAPAT